MGKLSRDKGANWERTVAGLLSWAGGENHEAARELTECRSGNVGDIQTSLPIVVQAKCGKRPRIYTAMREAVEAAEGTGRYPVAAIKRNSPGGGKPADELAVMRLQDLADLIRELTFSGTW